MTIDNQPLNRVWAPGRVNLIGDHTDYTGGLVFPMAINRWTEIAYRPSPRIELVSEDDSQPVSLDPTADLDSPTISSWGRYVAAVAAELRSTRGITGRVTTGIPVGAGLSSSAALEVAVALALGFDGEPIDLAELCRRAEHAATGVPTGIMDQLVIAAATEGHAALIDCHSLEISHVPMPDDVDIVVRFVASRTLEGSEYENRVAECHRAEEIIGPLRLATAEEAASIDDPVTRSRATHVVAENERVGAFAAAMAAGDLTMAGRIMTDGHASLRHLYETSTPEMDAAVDQLVATPGVYGARMTGGGFGGCVVALVEPGVPLDGWRVTPVAGAGRVPDTEPN